MRPILAAAGPRSHPTEPVSQDGLFRQWNRACGTEFSQTSASSEDRLLWRALLLRQQLIQDALEPRLLLGVVLFALAVLR